MTAPFEAVIRPAEAGDVAFVCHSWLESFHDGNAEMKAVRFGRYKEPMRRAIHATVGRGLVLVSYDPEQPGYLHGYIVAESRGGVATVHYVYTKQLSRGYGVARSLGREALARLEADAWQEYSHRTYIGARIGAKYGAEFNPFPAREAA